MTDREKAIATLTEHLDHWKRLLSEGICTKDDGERTIYALTMAIKALEQEPKWIPVSERLPNNHEYIKNNGLFNVSDGNRSYSEYFDIYDTERFGEPTMNGFRVDRCVVAWMPLPEPYKADKEVEE